MAKKKQSTGLVGLLETRQNYHSSQSIKKWEQAIAAFESPSNPSRVLLYDLYDEVLLDGHVESVWGKRQDGILNRRLSFVRDGVEDEEATKLLNSPDMRRLLKELLNTILYGYTLIQINSVLYDEEQECHRINFDLIPRKHVHPEPDFQCVSKEQSSVSLDFLYANPPLSHYMIWAGEPTDKGLLVKVAPYVIYKRGEQGDWAQFSEMFGMPFREISYDAYDEDTKKKLSEFMEQWSASTYLVHQSDVKVTIHPTGGSAQSADVYDRFIQMCDAGISKTILGNTLTTEQGANGARSLGEVHENEEDDKKASDEHFILSVLNTQLRAVFKRLGVNLGGGEIWFDAPEKDWNDLQSKWNVVSAVSDKIPVSDDYIYEEFDIPKPDNYEEMKEEMRVEKQAGYHSMFGVGEPPKGKEKPEKADDKKQNLFHRVINFFV
jgi:phage gp29-like protein